MTRTIPEWPEKGQPDIEWEITQPCTYFRGSIDTSGEIHLVVHDVCRSLLIGFGPYAQHPRGTHLYVHEAPPKRDSYFHTDAWPDWGWLIVVAGLYRTEGIVEGWHDTRFGRNLSLDEFDYWLAKEKPEILVDLRAAAIAEGYRPAFCGRGDESGGALPPPQLAHWYPERTVESCSPTREEWAEYRLETHIREDRCEFVKFDELLETEEFWGLCDQLKYERRDLLKKLQEAKKQFPHLFQRKGETKTDWIHRYYQMSREEQDLHSNLDTSYKCKELYQAIKILKGGQIPEHGHEGGYLPQIEALKERQEQLDEKRRAASRAQAAIDFPIDDAAWQKEVEQRKVKQAAFDTAVRAYRDSRNGKPRS